MVARKLFVNLILIVLFPLIIGSNCATIPAKPPEARDLFDKAVADLKDRRFEEAKYNFQKIYTDFPNSDLADDALYRIGYIECAQKDYAKALEYFVLLVEKYPKSEWSFDARVWADLLSAWRAKQDELDKVKGQLGISQNQTQTTKGKKDELSPTATKEIKALQDEVNQLREENRKLREFIESSME